MVNSGPPVPLLLAAAVLLLIVGMAIRTVVDRGDSSPHRPSITVTRGTATAISPRETATMQSVVSFAPTFLRPPG